MRTLRVVVGVIGGFFGFFLAAYPGVLLGATARPLFIGAHWLGALFLAIGASTGGAAIAFVLSLSGGQRGDALSRLMRFTAFRSEEHTSELQSQSNLVCRLLLEKKKKRKTSNQSRIDNEQNYDM